MKKNNNTQLYVIYVIDNQILIVTGADNIIDIN